MKQRLFTDRRRTSVQVIGTVATALLSLGLLSGCATSSSPSSKSSPAKSTKLTTVTLAPNSNAGSLEIDIADKQGIFKKNGLDAKITVQENQALSPAAVASGQFDFASITPPLFLNALLQHLPVVAVAGSTMETKANPQFALVVPQASKVKTLADLGKTKVGTITVQGNMSQCLQWDLHQHNLPAANLAVVPFVNMKSQMEAGQIGAAIVQTPLSLSLADEGYRVITDPCLSIGEPQQTAFQMANATWAKAHPQAVKAMQKSIQEAGSWADAHPAQTRAMLATWTGEPPADTKDFVPPTVVGTPPTTSDLGRWSNVLVTLGAMKTKPDLSDAIFNG